MAQQNSINNRSSTLTVDNTLTVTAGDATVSAGNIKLPTTTATTGQVQINATRFVHNYGTANTFVGETAGNTTLTTANANDETGIGYQALIALTTGAANTAVGYQSGVAITSGSNNTSVGLGSNQKVATTGGNTGIGYTANCSSGTNNTAVGMQASPQITATGSYNATFGYQAGVNYAGAESSNVLIMNTGTLGESNKMRIGTDGTGNGQVDTVVIAGTNASISTAATAGTVNIATGAASKVVTLGSTDTTSSLALKYGTADFTIASATGTVMTILDTGEMTMPLQSAFSAVVTDHVTDCTGDGTVYQFGTSAMTENFDQNADFNTNGTFSAPVSGRYMFGMWVLLNQVTTAMSTGLSFITSNRTYYMMNNASAFTGNNGYSITIFTDMDAGDTVTFNVSAGGGAKVVDIYGAAADQRSGCFGYLVC